MNSQQAVALEERPADLVVTGGRVYLSGRGAFLERDVVVVGNRIASIVDDASDVVEAETTVVDASGRVVLPGLIDAHTHVDTTVTMENWAPGLLETGTTAVVTEVSGLGPRFGAHGVDVLLEATESMPLTAYLCLPPQRLVDTFEPAAGDEAELEALGALLDHPRVVGVGEIDWIHVVGREPPLADLLDRTRNAGGVVVGHGAGCRGENLGAFATVVDNDHEAIAADGVLERATNGLHVVARCGSNRDDLDAVVDVFDDLGPSNVSLSTDGLAPGAVLDGFGMTTVLERTVEKGVDPATAVELATANPARHFGLTDRGVIAPRAIADLVIVDSMANLTVETVVADGDVVVTDGAADFEPPAVDYPEPIRDSVAVECATDRFTAPVADAPGGTVRSMAVDRGFITTETTVEPAVDGDRFGPAPEGDALTLTALDRRPDSTRGFTGFLTGYGLEAGAFATTGTWEPPVTLTVAAHTEDAVVATDHLAAIGGGMVVARDGEVIAAFPMPIGGAAAQCSLQAADERIRSIGRAVRRCGCDDRMPLLSIQTATFLGVPALKITSSGYADVMNGRLVGLAVDE